MACALRFPLQRCRCCCASSVCISTPLPRIATVTDFGTLCSVLVYEAPYLILRCAYLQFRVVVLSFFISYLFRSHARYRR